jgi:segregation and condensation protein A
VIESTPASVSQPLAGSSRTACAVKLPAFEGPLDLLLHLIRSNEVDIADIPIALISAQYLEYLELMRMLDIDVAAEYLLMAATLAQIKSRMLLPPDPNAEDDELGEDPRAELARRLAEYAVFKEAARVLDGRPVLGRDVFAGRSDPSAVPAREPTLDVSLFALLDAMRRVLEAIPAEERHHCVSLERIRLQDRMVYVMDRLRAAGTEAVLFVDLLLDEGSATRHKVVMTFLAMLELAKIQALRIFQNSTPEGLPFGPVRVRIAVQGELDEEDLAAAAEQAQRSWETGPAEEEESENVGPRRKAWEDEEEDLDEESDEDMDFEDEDESDGDEDDDWDEESEDDWDEDDLDEDEDEDDLDEDEDEDDLDEDEDDLDEDDDLDDEDDDLDDEDRD